MTTLQERVAAHFAESIRAKQEAEKVLVEPTVQAAELMLQCLMNDGKILACGNGGSAADAQHDYGFDHVFSKQVRALGRAGDVLVGISTSGNSANVIEAIKAAHERDMHVIAMTGRDGGKIAAILKDTDVLLNVPYPRTARIQENHILLIHAMCDCIDSVLFEGM